MRPLPILSAVFLTAATPVLAQVTVDLHALQALPDHSTVSRPVHAPPPVAARTPPSDAAHVPPSVAASAAPSVAAHAAPSVAASAPTVHGPAAPEAAAAAPAGARPALPEAVPDTAAIAPIAPPAAPPPGSPAPPAPPVSEKAATEAAPTTTGLRLTFAPGESDLSPESSESIKHLTAGGPLGDLTTFNVSAYAPGKADDPSTARRISLSRAMAVRSALVADGVPSARIFVRALGEQYGDGPPDRVDVSVLGANAPGGSVVPR
jgi:outer membrane protein OmpA-like peptidoglycan-associated protein